MTARIEQPATFLERILPPGFLNNLGGSVPPFSPHTDPNQFLNSVSIKPFNIKYA
jgi:hypothetical protein